MKALKIVGFSLLGLIGLILILGFISPKEIVTERSRTIKAPKMMVYETINDLETWENWSTWKEMDPEMKVTMGEKTVGKGASYSWTGPILGNGKMKISDSQEGKQVDTALEFDGFGNADASFKLEEVEGGTLVKWDFYQKMAVPFNLMEYVFNIKENLDKDFDRGLALLDQYLQEKKKNMTYQGLKVNEIDTEEQYFIGIREVISIQDIQKHYAENLPKAFAAVTAAGIEMAGMPSGLLYSYDEENGTTDIAQVIPVKEPKELEGFETFTIPAGKCLHIDYYGDYSATETAHVAMDEYIKANSLTHKFPVIEQYVTDPGQEPDPSKWLTKVYYPLQ